MKSQSTICSHEFIRRDKKTGKTTYLPTSSSRYMVNNYEEWKISNKKIDAKDSFKRPRVNKICDNKTYYQMHKLRSKYGHMVNIEFIQSLYERNILKFGRLTCYLCLTPIEFGKDCVEHKRPVSRGGLSNLENMDIAHIVCNLRKSNKTEAQYRLRFDL